MMTKWVVGIDEAGRGPLAGPVSVGLVLVPADFDWDIIPGVGDSKVISEKKRTYIYQQAAALAKQQQLFSVVEMVGAAAIDARGIAVVIREAIEKGLLLLLRQANVTPAEVSVKLDGSLAAPSIYMQQETIIKGDATEKVIGLASIMAKVTRDSYMARLAEREDFSVYHFARHKGYGTVAHRKAIATHGLSPEHRRTYCKNIKMLYGSLPARNQAG